MDYRIDDTNIYTAGEVLKFSRSITHAIQIDDTIIIRLKLMGFDDNCNNIYAIRNGK